MNNLEKIRIAVAALESDDFEIQDNLNRIESLMSKAKHENADFLFLGEAVLNGFSGLKWIYEKDIRENAIPLESPVIDSIRTLCAQVGIGIGVGYYEKLDDLIYSSYLIMNKQGKFIENYRRMSTGWKGPNFSDTHYKEGNSIPSFWLGRSKCTISICGDLWTEDIIKKVIDHESDTIIWPLYIDYSKEEWESIAKQEYLDQIQSIGKRTILINSFGVTPDSANGGLIDISPDGIIQDEVDMMLSEILILEL